MAKSTPNPSLRSLLSLANDVWETSDPAVRPSGPGAFAAQRELRLPLLRELAAALSRRGALPTPLREIQEWTRARPRDLALLLLLIHHRIADDSRLLTGRDLVEVLATDAHGMLRLAQHLEADGPLVRHGLVRTRGPMNDPLDAGYRLAEPVFREVARHVVPARRAAPVAPVEGYATPHEHLLDVRRLLDLHRARSAQVFPESGWADTPPLTPWLADDLTDAILRLRSHIAARILETSKDTPLPLRTLTFEHGIADDEELIIIALFFHELLVAATPLDAGDLIRLVCPTEPDVLLRWKLLGEEGVLRRSGIVEVDPMDDERDVGGDVVLSAWAFERLLPAVEGTTSIGADDRRRFLRFLDGLGSSDEFYRRL